jgi:hypothetical protein
MYFNFPNLERVFTFLTISSLLFFIPRYCIMKGKIAHFKHKFKSSLRLDKVHRPLCKSWQICHAIHYCSHTCSLFQVTFNYSPKLPVVLWQGVLEIVAGPRQQSQIHQRRRAQVNQDLMLHYWRCLFNDLHAVVTSGTLLGFRHFVRINSRSLQRVSAPALARNQIKF